MTRARTWAVSLAGMAALAVIGFLLVVGLAGVRGAHANFIIATFTVRGVGSDAEAASFKDRLALFPGYKEAAIARHSWTENLWLARVQFQSAGPETAREEIRRWLESLPGTIEARPVLATYYEYRLERPGKGDLVFGDRVSILPLDRE